MNYEIKWLDASDRSRMVESKRVVEQYKPEPPFRQSPTATNRKTTTGGNLMQRSRTRDETLKLCQSH